MNLVHRILLGVTVAILPAGCVNGLHDVMSENGFTEIRPPQTNWEVGLIAEIDDSFPEGPALRATPKAAGAPNFPQSSTAPSVSTSHDKKVDLALGVGLPEKIRGKLKAEHASGYTVVAKGNSISRVLLDQYADQTFPAMRERYSQYWSDALDAGNLYYMYELWCATNLEYKFYDNDGGELELEVPVEVPVELKATWEFKDSGTLAYSGGEPICLGYKARPIRRTDNGVAAGRVLESPLVIEGLPAITDPWEK